MFMICDECKKEFRTFPCYLKRKREHRFCSKKCEAKFKNYNNSIYSWKGGYISKSNGYKYVRFKGNRIEEHRLVVANSIGRELRNDEHVHHINGDKLDNRIENLLLTTAVAHPSFHKTSNERVCAKCGLLKPHHARGLCDTCYHWELIKGGLNQYEKQI